MDLQIPRGLGGFLTRRRQESQGSELENRVNEILDPRIEALEAEVSRGAASIGEQREFEAQRELGYIAMVRRHWERANAHFHRAHELEPEDLETIINFGIVLAQRGQLQPAIDLFEETRKRLPNVPLLQFNFALVALQARRPQLALDAVAALEGIWRQDVSILTEYQDDAMTVRGLALLMLNKPGEARAALSAAARHDYIVMTSASKASSATLRGPGESVEAGAAVAPAAVAVAEESGTSLDGRGERHHESLDGEDMVWVAGEHDPEPNDGHELSVDDLMEQESQSGDADLLNNLAVAEAAQGDIERAVEHLYTALRLEPHHTRVLNNLGVLAYQQGRLEIAYKYLDVARQIEEYIEQPEPATYNHLGVVLSAMGKLDLGLEGFHHAGTHERADFEAHYNLGRAYIEFGRPEQGVEHLRHAFQLDPNQADVHVVLGAAYLLRGKTSFMNDALKHLKQALRLNPHHRIAFADLAMTMMEMDNMDAAVKVLSTALKLHPKSAEAMFELGLVVMERGGEQRWAQAAAQFGAALDLRPDMTACLYNVALCHYLMGFRDSAAEQLQIVIDRDKAFAPAYYMIGVGHAVAKRYNQALLAWQKALEYEPANTDLHANIGFVYYTREDYKTAVKSFTQAHRLDPKQPDLLSALGLCFARDKKIGQALAAFQQSLNLNPRSAITHSNIGLAYYINSDVEKAVEHWRMVAQLDAGYAERRGEEQQRNFDESLVAMRPLQWRSRVTRMAPVLPRPHTRLLHGYNARDFRPATADPTLREAFDLRRREERSKRRLALMNARF